MSVLDTIIGGAFWFVLLVVGLLLVAFAVDRVGNVRSILTTPTADAGFVGEGRTELKGKLRADRTITSPLTGTDCVAYEWTVKEHDRDASDVLKSWDTVEQGGAAVPFYVTDGTGEVLVDPAERGDLVDDEPGPDEVYEAGGVFSSGMPTDLDLPAEDELDVSAHQEPAADVAAFLADQQVAQQVSEHDRKLIEKRLEPGTEVYVLGGAVDGSVHGETTVENRTGNRFIVSADSETRTALWNAGAAVAAFVVGVVLVVVSGYVLLATVGVV